MDIVDADCVDGTRRDETVTDIIELLGGTRHCAENQPRDRQECEKTMSKRHTARNAYSKVDNTLYQMRCDETAMASRRIHRLQILALNQRPQTETPSVDMQRCTA